jgi:plastocyanin/LysM repeat protein/mono/diheme cytochrome c family protein
LNTQKQIILIVALFFLTVGACAGYTIIELPYRTELQADWHLEESIERGALLYANNCRTCHGNAGEGFRGPRLNRDDLKDQSPLVLAENRRLIERTLLCGRAGTLMPAWLSANGGSLNETQIEHLINFLTAPIDEEVVDENGLPSNTGWVEAVHFAHNLNHETTVLVAGDTLQNIAAQHRIGIAELAASNGLPADDPELLIEDGTVLELPAVGGEPDGGEFEVDGDNVTLRRAADSTFLGAALLADLNNLDYELSFAHRTFVLLDGGNEVPGLLTTQTLVLPEGSVYVASSGDTLESVAELHGLSVEDLLAANPDMEGSAPGDDLAPADDEGVIPVVVLNLPAVEAYQVRGQSWEDVAEGYGNVTPEALAEHNELTVEDTLRVAQQLGLPPAAYGSAPPDAINQGTACVQYTVPNSIYEAIRTGGSIGGEEFEGTVVARDSNSFVQRQITLPPDTEVTITFDNQDEVNTHNIAFWESPTPGQGEVLTGCTAGCLDDGDAVRTEDSMGPVQHTFTFTTPAAGSYSFNCEIHPTTMTGTLTVEDGAEVP